MLSSLLLGSSWRRARCGFAGAHALREARNAESQINTADRAKMAVAEQRTVFSAVLARRPRVDAIFGRAIGNAPHHVGPMVKVSRRRPKTRRSGLALQEADSRQLTD